MARLGRRGLEKRSSKQNVTLFLDPFGVDSGLVILVVLLFISVYFAAGAGEGVWPSGCWQRWVWHVPVGSGATSLCVCVCAVHIHVGMDMPGNMWLACACGSCGCLRAVRPGTWMLLAWHITQMPMLGCLSPVNQDGPSCLPWISLIFLIV